MSAGYCIYDDYPADGFNVDHLVIASAGVLAVATHARRKPITGNGRAESQVDYIGQILRFASWTDRKTLDQTQRQAQWLSRWLSSAVGESVSVRAVVA
jgi:hypothetical protein